MERAASKGNRRVRLGPMGLRCPLFRWLNLKSRKGIYQDKCLGMAGKLLIGRHWKRKE